MLRLPGGASPLEERSGRAAELAGLEEALARMQLLIVVNDGGVHLGPGGLLRAHANGGEDLGSGFSAASASRDQHGSKQAADAGGSAAIDRREL